MLSPKRFADSITAKRSNNKHAEKGSGSDSMGFKTTVILLLLILIFLVLRLPSSPQNRQTNDISATTTASGEQTEPMEVTTSSPSEKKREFWYLTVWNSKSSGVPMSDYHIKKTIYPINYHVTFQIFIGKCVYCPELEIETYRAFNGTVVIDLEIREKTNLIELNQNGLTIDKEGCLLEINNQSVEILLVNQIDIYEKLVIVSSQMLKPGDDVRISIPYRGDAQPVQIGVGIFDSVYLDNNTYHSNIILALEPDYARLAFPCFDEPEYKATWQADIIHPNHTHALFNTREIETTPVAGTNFLLTKFRRSEFKMASYLVSMVISQYHYIEGHTKRGIRVRVYSAPVYDKSQLQHGLTSAIELIDAFEKLLDTKFHQDKIDLVATEVFYAGALESWGLIVFVSNALVSDPDHSNDGDISQVVAHELAHQWFGNQVTLKFWDEIIVNEGLASVFEELAIVVTGAKFDYVFTEKRIATSSRILGTLRQIPLPSMRTRFDMRSQIRNMDYSFSSTVHYKKGAAFFYMIWRIMEEKPSFSPQDRFISSLAGYLKKYKYKNAKVSDVLRETIEKVAGFEGFLDGWLDITTYPILEVYSENSTHIAVTSKKDHKDQVNVPVIIQRNLKGPYELYKLYVGETIYIKANSDETILVNPERIALARVRYSKELFDHLHAKLKELNETKNVNLHILIDDAKAEHLHNVTLKDFPHLTKQKSDFSWKFLANSIDLHDKEEKAKLSEVIESVLPEILSEVDEEYTERNQFVFKFSCRIDRKFCNISSRLNKKSGHYSSKLNNLLSKMEKCYEASHEKAEDVEAELLASNNQNISKILFKIACSTNKDFIRKSILHVCESFEKQPSPEISEFFRKLSNHWPANEVLKNIMENDINAVPMGFALEIQRGMHAEDNDLFDLDL